MAEELGAQADEAITTGRLQFAEGFLDVESRRVYLHGTDQEREILLLEAELKYLKSLEK